jgi:uncharacterized membrane protein
MTGLAAGWGEFTAALAIFLISHILPARPPVRRFLHAALGARGYTILYSAISLAIFAWLIGAAGRAPRVQLWDFEPWQLWVPNMAMPFACLLIAYGIGAPGSFSIAGKSGATFVPERPGIAGITRHPLLWAVTLWAAAHIVPNGDLAHAVLFGLFAAFGLAGMAALDRRRRREWGAALWAKRSAHTSLVPFLAVLAGRFRGAGLGLDPIRAAAAVALYVTLLLSHPAVIGVSPLPYQIG